MLLKRDADAGFGFLKMETGVKTESRLKMRRMLKANIMGNAYDLNEQLDTFYYLKMNSTNCNYSELSNKRTCTAIYFDAKIPPYKLIR